MRISIMIILGLCLTMFGIDWVAPVRGEPQPLELTITPGFDGQVKAGKWFPVTFTMANPGAGVTGELAVQMASPAGGKDIVYRTHVDLPEQSSKTVTLFLPGAELSKRNNAVYFFKGSLENGTKLAWKNGAEFIRTSLLEASAVQVAVLARDANTLNFLPMLNQKGHPARAVALTEGQLPLDPIGLDGIDALVLNDFPADKLKPDQVKAVEGWVRRGGQLILAGGASYPHSAGPFSALSPVDFQGTIQVSELPSLAAAAGKPLRLDAAGSAGFTVSKAAVRDGSVLYGENGLPLFASHALGAGEVWYAAYDLAQQPLASWNGNPEIWNAVLSSRFAPDRGGEIPFFGQTGSGDWELDNALDYFPKLAAPPFGLLVLIIFGYAAVIGPLLYVLLKRMDRREWAWIAVPALALICTLGVYGAGASGRGQTLAQSLSTIQLDGQGSGQRSGAFAVFVPRGGSYVLELGNQAYAAPLPADGGSRGADMNGEWAAAVGQEQGSASLLYRDVAYWSLRKGWFESGGVEPFGRLEAKLDTTAPNASGSVTNNTKTDLRNVYLLINQQIVQIGDLKAGAEASFDQTIGNLQDKVSADLGNRLFPFEGSSDRWRRERGLVNSYVQRSWLGKQSGPLLLGFSETASSLGFKIDGKSVQTDDLSLWVQPVGSIPGPADEGKVQR